MKRSRCEGSDDHEMKSRGSWDYYTEDDEFIGSDGVDDGLKHTISKDDFNANMSYAKLPKYKFWRRRNNNR